MAAKVKINSVEAERFKRAKFRLLHCQTGGQLIPEGLRSDKWKSNKGIGRNLNPLSTCCGSVWKPGWGLHADCSVVELKMRPDAEIVVWTHDGFSEALSSLRGMDQNKIWGDRRLGKYNWPRYFRSVLRPEELGVTLKAIKNRETAMGVMPCSDPVNEMWFKLVDVIAMRAIAVHGTARGYDGNVNTHDVDNLRIKTVSDWAEFSLQKVLDKQTEGSRSTWNYP